jgi:hypothetical protein
VAHLARRRSYQDNRYGRQSTITELCDQFGAAQARHPHVQQDERGRMADNRRLRAVTWRQRVGDVAFVGENLNEQIDNCQIIVDDQNGAGTIHRYPFRLVSATYARLLEGQPTPWLHLFRRNGSHCSQQSTAILACTLDLIRPFNSAHKQHHELACERLDAAEPEQHDRHGLGQAMTNEVTQLLQALLLTVAVYGLVVNSGRQEALRPDLPSQVRQIVGLGDAYTSRG